MTISIILSFIAVLSLAANFFHWQYVGGRYFSISAFGGPIRVLAIMSALVAVVALFVLMGVFPSTILIFFLVGDLVSSQLSSIWCRRIQTRTSNEHTIA